MGIGDSLRNAKYECRYALYGGLGPLVQKLYEGGFKHYDGGKLDKFLGEQSQLPNAVAATLVIWGSYKAGKAIDGNWFKPLRGSVQTIAYGSLVAALFAAGTYLNPDIDSQKIDYVSTAIDNTLKTLSVFSDGEMAPLLYTVLYGGLLTGAARWAKNVGSSFAHIFLGKAGPSEDYKDENSAPQK